MTTRQLVQQLQSQGYQVKYHIRKDGGVLISSINGAKFKGAKGNIYARQLLGVEISQRRSQQLSKIRYPFYWNSRREVSQWFNISMVQNMWEKYKIIK